MGHLAGGGILLFAVREILLFVVRDGLVIVDVGLVLSKSLHLATQVFILLLEFGHFGSVDAMVSLGWTDKNLLFDGKRGKGGGKL